MKVIARLKTHLEERRVRKMFDSILIKMKRPICKCETQDITWALFIKQFPLGLGVGGLRLTCRLCGICLEIPYSTLTAAVTFKKGYSGGTADAEVEMPDGSKIDAKEVLKSLEKQMAKEDQ
jgi:hypothetical protein